MCLPLFATTQQYVQYTLSKHVRHPQILKNADLVLTTVLSDVYVSHHAMRQRSER